MRDSPWFVVSGEETKLSPTPLAVSRPTLIPQRSHLSSIFHQPSHS